MIFPAQAGGMSSLVSLVSPHFRSLCRTPRVLGLVGVPGGQQAQQLGEGVAGVHPTEKYQLGNEEKRVRGRVGVSGTWSVQ